MLPDEARRQRRRRWKLIAFGAAALVIVVLQGLNTLGKGVDAEVARQQALKR